MVKIFQYLLQGAVAIQGARIGIPFDYTMGYISVTGQSIDYLVELARRRLDA